MTPINFVSFLLALQVVEGGYERRREYPFVERGGRWSLAWLHGLLYKPDMDAAASRHNEHWYYHSKQKKLMRMEASQAMKMRKKIVLGLAIAALAVVWIISRVVAGIWTRSWRL
ncbi:hypothetical protein BX600DRAFT_453305 [Xylariales sp. PMI_506]|nr:hypothetical protein BX600DRAFT_453305 [Xylariales sp. PMI_506]